MPKLDELTQEQKDAIVAHYREMAAQDDAQYNALQCAAYNEKDKPVDEVALDIDVLIERYQTDGVLEQELRYSEGTFGENILHIAVKYPSIFKACCAAAKSVHLLETLFTQVDGDEDTILHHITEYGRTDSLNVMLSDDEMAALVPTLLRAENKYQESVPELLGHFADSKTIQNLLATNKYYPPHFANALANLQAIQTLLEDSLELGAAARC